MDINFLLLLGIVFFFVFYRVVFLGYVVDDVDWYKRGINARRIFLTPQKFLPVKISFKYWLLNFRHMFYGAGLFTNRKLDHIFSAVLHLVNCVLIYSIISGPVGFLAALLYLVNPVNNQITLWLNGRRYLIVVFLVLLSFKFKWLSLLLCPAMNFIHVSGMALPLVLGVPYGPIVALLALCAIPLVKAIIKDRKEGWSEKNECQSFHWRKSILYVKSVGFYFFHILLPVKPCMYHDFLYYFSRYSEEREKGYAIDMEFFRGVLALSYLGWEIGFNHSIWAWWFLVFISQWCNVWNVTMHVADRYCSLAGIGLMVLLSQKILMLPSPYGSVVFALVFVLYWMKYNPLFTAYLGYHLFLDYEIALQPQHPEARFVKAANYVQCEKPDLLSAYAVLRQGLIWKPKDFKLLLLMAQTHCLLGKYEAGLKILDRAEKQIPLGDEAEGLVMFADVRKQIGEAMDAKKTQTMVMEKIFNSMRPVNANT